MTPAQHEILTALLGTYIGRLPDAIAEREMAKVTGPSFPALHLAWAGSLDPRRPHYYRIQGQNLLIEFDNAIDNGNHIHSVWRDYRADLGHALLLDHYEYERHHGHHLDTRLKSSVPEDD